VWAPPIGSRMMSSMMPKPTRSGAVSLSAFGGLGLLRRIAHTSAAHLRANDAVDRVLLHEHPVADRDAERAPPLPPFALTMTMIVS